MSKNVFSRIELSNEWSELLARAINYKDTNGNYKTDYLSFNPYSFEDPNKGDLIEFTNFDETQHIYFHIDKVEPIVNNNNYILLTGYWVWSVYAGCVKSVDDLPTDAHEGEYYLIKKSDKTPIKDYVYYERVGDEWKKMGTYWG